MVQRCMRIVTSFSCAIFVLGLDLQPQVSFADTSSYQTSHDLKSNPLDEQLTRLGNSLGSPSVNARVDRVWHAIPGLTGWSLDVTASRAQTLRTADHNLHLVWKVIEPTRRLRDLPPEPIYRGPDREKSVSLMFNVSWGEEYLPGLLEALGRHHVRATFFLDGAWVKRHPDLTRQIATAGHSVGSHGMGHPDFRRLSDGALVDQVIQTNRLIQNTIGQLPHLIAPPAGSFDMRFVEIAHRQHVYTILWTTDTVDWKRPPANLIVARATRGIANGTLILMHPTANTVEALPRILATLQNQGFVFKTVDQVVLERPASPPPVALSKQP